jgi:molecular chaperone DnaK
MAFVGIDLGTTTSEVALYEDDDGPRIIRDWKGNEIVDSAVGIDNKTRRPVVGDRALALMKSSPDLCLREVKRRMGEEDDLPLGDQSFRPEEVSAFILKYLKNAAEAELDEEVDRAVVTVPANFPDTARQATLQAGEIAGLSVERIINEPTAAALAYGHSEGLSQEIVMVYDLGGGTFDVSIVEYVGNTLEVLASSGDPHLGGGDFDAALADHVAAQFKEETGETIDPDGPAYYNLLEACEEAKKELSFAYSTRVHIPFFMVRDGERLSLDVEVSRNEFEQLVAPLVDRTEEAIEKAMEDAGVGPGDTSRVLLVGGSTRIPYVRGLVERIMGQEPLWNIDADRAVALGAAVQAAIIDGRARQSIMDVCPLSLGTATAVTIGGALMPGRYAQIIPPNWKVRKPKKDRYATINDGQDSIDFKVYQRSSLSASEWAEIGNVPNTEDGYTLLAQREVEVPPGPSGQEIQATYTYDENGLLNVEVEVLATGETMEFEVSTPLDREQVEASRQKVETAWKASEHFKDVQATLHAAEKRLQQEKLDPQAERQLQQLIQELKSVLSENDTAHVEQYEDKINDLLYELDL